MLLGSVHGVVVHAKKLKLPSSNHLSSGFRTFLKRWKSMKSWINSFSSSMMFPLMFKANPSLFSAVSSLIHSNALCFSGSWIEGVSRVFTSNQWTLQGFHNVIIFTAQRYSWETTFTQISSFSSLFVASSRDSQGFTFHPGKNHWFSFAWWTIAYLHSLSLITHATTSTNPSSVDSYFSDLGALWANFIVIAISCLSSYQSEISLLARGVAQLGQYPWTLNPLYTLFWL